MAYKVFIASPGDVATERALAAQAIGDVNEMLASRDIELELIGWDQNATPMVANDPQDAVNQQIDPGECDIFLGVIWSRLGTQTPRAPSGTVEEFEAAYEHWKEHGSPRIMFYFSRVPLMPELEDLEQLKGALEFQRTVSSRGLVAEYRDVSEFARLVVRHLHLAAEQLFERDQAEEALGQSAPEEGSDLSEVDEAGSAAEVDTAGIDAVDLKLRLDAKMAWVCKHLLAGPDTTTFATIGSLRNDGYLTDAQARVASAVITREPSSFADMQPEDAARLRDTEERFVGTFRASVFDGFVRKEIRRLDWRIVDFEQGPGHRADFYVERPDGPRIRVSPRLAFYPESEVLGRTMRRLRESTDDTEPVDRRMIVVPEKSSIETTLDSDPQVVRYGHLANALGA